MPTTAARLRLLVWAGLVVVAAFVGPALLPGTAVAAVMESPAPTAEPTPTPTQAPPCIPPVAGCVTPGPSAEPTATAAPTRTATSAPSATRSPTPSPTRTATKSPKPAPQPVDDGVQDEGGSLEDPVTGGGVLGTLSPWTESPDAMATPSTAEVAAGEDAGSDDPLTRAITLVLGLGVLLGLVGGTGLYVTRHSHEH